MKKSTVWVGILLVLVVTISLIIAHLERRMASAKNHECCFRPAVMKESPKSLSEKRLSGTVKEVDLQKDSVTIQMKESGRTERFQLMDHLQQKTNEYRELFRPGNDITGTWDDSRKGYKIQK